MAHEESATSSPSAPSSYRYSVRILIGVIAIPLVCLLAVIIFNHVSNVVSQFDDDSLGPWPVASFPEALPHDDAMATMVRIGSSIDQIDQDEVAEAWGERNCAGRREGDIDWKWCKGFVQRAGDTLQ